MYYNHYHISITTKQNEKLVNLCKKANEQTNKKIYRNKLVSIAVQEYLKRCENDENYFFNTLENYIML